MLDHRHIFTLSSEYLVDLDYQGVDACLFRHHGRPEECTEALIDLDSLHNITSPAETKNPHFVSLEHDPQTLRVHRRERRKEVMLNLNILPSRLK